MNQLYKTILAALLACPVMSAQVTFYVQITGVSAAGVPAGVGNSGWPNTSTGQVFTRVGGRDDAGSHRRRQPVGNLERARPEQTLRVWRSLG